MIRTSIVQSFYIMNVPLALIVTVEHAGRLEVKVRVMAQRSRYMQTDARYIANHDYLANFRQQSMTEDRTNFSDATQVNRCGIIRTA